MPLLLFLNPLLEIVWFLSHHLQQHLRMLYATELSATSPVNARLTRIEPHMIQAAGNQIRLAAQFGRPKTMDDVVTRQLKVTRVLVIMRNRDVDFIRGDNTAEGVTHFPPVLVSDHLHVDCRTRRTCIF